MTEKKMEITLKEITSLKQELKELKIKYERLRSFVGYDELEGWIPNPQMVNQYGFIHAWLYPVNSFMNHNLNQPLTADIRNQIISIITAIIAQIAISDKHGIKLPFEPKEVDLFNFQDKQVHYYEYSYGPCEICGEIRITHQCHIIPRFEGGPNHRDNFVILCPIHHHLFDNHRLTKEEWQILFKVIEGKMPSAIVYAKEVHEKRLIQFWNNPIRKYPTPQ